MLELLHGVGRAMLGHVLEMWWVSVTALRDQAKEVDVRSTCQWYLITPLVLRVYLLGISSLTSK